MLGLYTLRSRWERGKSVVAQELGLDLGQRTATITELLLVRDELKGQIQLLVWAMGAGLLILLAILGTVLTIALTG